MGCVMSPVELKFGIPDLELDCRSGKSINPSDFAGHELVALFCPLDPAAASAEIAAWRRRSSELVKRDAWLLTFAELSDELLGESAQRMSIIPDPRRHAWTAFCDLTGHGEDFSRSSGATFLFTRGGGLHRHWPGIGHVDEVLAELQTPSFAHQHQRTY